MSTNNHQVAVYGAYGHTGRFVVTELRDRGFTPVLSGRDEDRLRALAAAHPGTAVRPAAVDDPAALDRALAGVAAVINCAGPFAVTAGPVIEAALRAGIPYLDVAAEIEANLDTFAHFGDRARAAGATVVPAMAFYGGLGDLLVSAVLAGETRADEVHVGYGLSSWQPTAGTRAAGVVSSQRRDGRRVRYQDGRLQYHDAEPTTLTWDFPAPIGPRTVLAEFTMADVVTLPSHLDVGEVCTYMTTEAARDLAAPDTSTPAAGGQGRLAETFVVEVLVRDKGTERRAVARGRDIYAVTAPLVVEAVRRVLAGETRAVGVASAGEIFDPADFLRVLAARGALDVTL